MASPLKPQLRPAESLTLISESSLTCLNSFHHSLNALEDPVALDLAQNQLIRFNLWVSNIAALSTNRSSLDFRLQNSPDIRSMVLQLLNILQLSLQQSVELKDSPAPDLTLSSTESSSSESSSSSSEAINQPFRKGNQEAVPISPSLQALKAAESTIDRLQRLSIAIRRSATLSRNSKAAEFKEKDENGNDKSQAFELYATRIVQHRYKNASEGLCKLLGASMSLRRKRFLYFKRHQQKLALQQQLAVLPETHLPDILTRLQGDAREGVIPSENAPPTKPEAPTVSRTNLFSHTTASALDPDRFKMVAFTAKTSSTRSEGVTQDFNIEFPPAPKIPEDVKEFECPFCCLVLSSEIALTEKKWRSHVMEDLEPYACVCEGCPHPVTLFRTSKEWLNHLQWEHSLQWSCTAPIHPPQSFDQKEDFERHMADQHADSFTASQLPVLIKAAATPATDVLTFCPFCDCLPEGIELGEMNTNVRLDPLLRHVAAHLKALAILCLPDQDYEVSSKASSSDRSVIKRTASVFGSSGGHPQLSSELELGVTDQVSGHLTSYEGVLDDPVWNPTIAFAEWDFLSRKKYHQLEDPVLQRFRELQQATLNKTEEVEYFMDVGMKDPVNILVEFKRNLSKTDLSFTNKSSSEHQTIQLLEPTSGGDAEFVFEVQSSTESNASNDEIFSLGTKPYEAESPTRHQENKGVTWGENETKHYEIESPTQNRDELLSDPDSGNTDVLQDFDVDSTLHKDGEDGGFAFDGVTEPPKDSKSKSRYAHIQGSFDDDPEFTATVAAGLRDAGFDPNTVIDDDLDFTAVVAADLRDTGFDPSIVIDDPQFSKSTSAPLPSRQPTYSPNSTPLPSHREPRAPRKPSGLGGNHAGSLSSLGETLDAEVVGLSNAATGIALSEFNANHDVLGTNVSRIPNLVESETSNQDPSGVMVETTQQTKIEGVIEQPRPVISYERMGTPRAPEYDFHDFESVPTRFNPAHRTRIESVPKVVTVEREPDFTRKRSPSIGDQGSSQIPRSEHANLDGIEQLERLQDKIEHINVSKTSATIGAAISALKEEESRQSRSERRRDERGLRRRDEDGCCDGHRDQEPERSEVDGRCYSHQYQESEKENVRDPVQEEADRAYREIIMARRIASRITRSRSPSSERSIVDKYNEREPEPVMRIFTPPNMRERERTDHYDDPATHDEPSASSIQSVPRIVVTNQSDPSNSVDAAKSSEEPGRELSRLSDSEVLAAEAARRIEEQVPQLHVGERRIDDIRHIVDIENLRRAEKERRQREERRRLELQREAAHPQQIGESQH
ncbi:hypothetical protein G7Y89_g10517 [Cudoniella acicularis]|uniref:Oxidoreductase acuF-like C2H2 type zinc-finger domain-containing protein n=1 Tax=Cudoniella acicularis TaxID=354080 RepID=A0A8H4RCM0_9HELO|nr:hypothetical protein G7Y89_g10517 [Cudoniella acicularis]